MATYTVLGSREAAAASLDARIAALQALDHRLDRLIAITRRLADDSPDSPLARRCVTSDSAAVATGMALPLAAIGQHVVVVEALATAHTIGSDALPATIAAIPAGAYRFVVGVGARRAEVEVVVEPDDPNEAVFQAIAGAIQAADVGAAAFVRVARTDRSDLVRLCVVSRRTGLASALWTADASRNLMVLIGLSASGKATERNGGTIVTPRDATFYLDDEPRTAPANRIYLADRRICLAIHGRGTATLSVRPDPAAILEGLGEWSAHLDRTRSLAADPPVRGVLEGGDFVTDMAALAPDLARYDAGPAAIRAALEADPDAYLGGLMAPGRGLADRVVKAAMRTRDHLDEAVLALQRQADWFRSLPSARAATQIARRAIASYGPTARAAGL